MTKTTLLLAEQAFLALKALLLQGQIRAGQMVSMSELVEQTHLPLAPVREAVKRAEAVGLVRILPKRGVLVIEPTPTTVRECFRLRCLMDQEGARVLATRSAVDAMQALHQAHAQVREQAMAGITPALQQEAMAVDWSLHLALSRALDNPLADQVYTSNHERIVVLQRSRRLLPERIIPAMDEHLQILDAILQGDAVAAMQAVRDHLAGTLRWWGIYSDETALSGNTLV